MIFGISKVVRFILAGVAAFGLVGCGAEADGVSQDPLGSASAGIEGEEAAQPAFNRPESAVAWDGHWYVSNQGGVEKLPEDGSCTDDGDGFIMRVSRDGTERSVWIDEGLNNPTGLTLWGDNLVVADNKCIKIFDIPSALLVTEHCVEEATFFNDPSVYPSANSNGAVSGPAIIVSDRPFVANTGQEAIWVIHWDSGEASRLFGTAAHSPAPLNLFGPGERPNGTFVHAGLLYIADNLGQIQRLDLRTNESLDTIDTGSPGLDGIARVGNDLLVSSNPTGLVLRIPINGDGEVTPVFSVSPLRAADIGSMGKLVLVPHLVAPSVTVVNLNHL